MKMITLLLMTIIFMTPLVLAQENKSNDFMGWIFNSINGLWENWFGGNVIETSNNLKEYDLINKEITISNSSGDIAKIKLNTPLNYNVLVGNDVKVAEFTINNLNDKDAVFNDLKFYNLQNGNEIVKNFTYKYLFNETYQIDVPKYKEVCNNTDWKNGTNEKIICYWDFDRYEREDRYRDTFKILDDEKKSKLPKGNITIGIFTDTYKGEVVEWIPTLFDTIINEWANYTVADCQAMALGGTITLNNTNCVHTFLTNGSFNITSGSLNVTVLVVGGGGGGGSWYGGGGGAGGLVYNTSYIVSGNISVIIGNNGTGAVNKGSSKNGTNSSFGLIVAMGGGGGSSENFFSNYGGSSGGGSASKVNPANSFYPQGMMGGKGNQTTNLWGGGGGGATTNGSRIGSANVAGMGGNGTLININGSSFTFAGGGGGGGRVGQITGGVAGLGGGGTGSGTGNGGNAILNTGGGGGGGADGGTGNGGAGGTGIVIVTYPAVSSDTSYPLFSNYSIYPNNGSQYYDNFKVFFNVTVINTNGSVNLITSDDLVTWTEYPMNNISNVFYANVTNFNASPPDNMYYYSFEAYGNGSLSLYNSTDVYTYIILKNNTYNLSIIGSSPLIYPSQAGISNSSCPPSLTCNLYRNNTNVNSPDNTILGVGYYNYTFNSTDNGNYTAKSSSLILQVQINTSSCNIQFNATSPQTYPYKFKVYSNCTSANYITRNGTIILNNSEQDLSAGTYNFTVFRNDTVNYTNIISTSDFIINKGTIIITKLLNGGTNNITIIYPQQVNATGSSTIGTIKIYRNEVDKTAENGLNISLGVGGYIYKFNVTGNDNYSDIISEYMQVNISKGNSSVGMSITGTTPITYTETSDFLGTENNTGDGECVYSMDRNNQVYGVGTWTFNYSTSGCINYTSGSVTKDLIVNKNSTYVLSINKTTPINYGTTTDFTGLGCPSQLSCSLNITNQVYSAGVIWANYSTNGNANYTENSVIDSITINKATSQTSLTFDKASPQEYETSITPNCSLINGVGSVSLTNGTSGVSEVLGAGTWTFNCSYSGNTNYSESSNTTNYIINKNSSYNLGINGTTPIIYPAVTDVSGSNCPSQLNCSLDKANLVYGVGNVTFNYSTNGNNNYTANSTTKIITINQNSTYLLSLISIPSWNIILGQDTNITGSNCPNELICNLYRNNSLVSNPDVSFLNVGSYNYTFNTSGNTNYSFKSTSNILNVSNYTTTQGTLATPKCRYLKLGYYNLNIPFLSERNCDTVQIGGLGYG